MRHLFSWLAGSMIGGTLLLGASPAEALSNQEIVDKLEPVPVFLILNAEGQPLSAAASSEAGEVRVPVVFTDGLMAEEFLDDAQAEDAQAQLALVDLGSLYEQTQEESNQPPTLLYLPNEGELEAATSIQANFQGVPLFFAREGDEGALLSINQGGEVFVPMFFSRDDLQLMLDRYQQENPAEADQMSAQVMPLEGLLQMMATSDDPQLNRIQLFPSSEVIEYLQSQPQMGPESTPEP